jgi:hypothetical protein
MTLCRIIVATPISHQMRARVAFKFYTARYLNHWPHRTQCSILYKSQCGSNHHCQTQRAQDRHSCFTFAPLSLYPIQKTLSSSISLHYNLPIYWGLVRRGEAVLYSVWTPLAPPRSAFLLQSLLLSPFIPQNAHHACTHDMHATRAHVRLGCALGWRPLPTLTTRLF